MFRVNQLIGFGGGGAANLAYTHLGDGLAGDNQTTHTVSGAALGTESADRWIVVTYGHVDRGSVSSITVGGNTATIAHQATISSGARAGIAYVLVPTGTTGDIVYTHSEDVRALVGWGAITGSTNLSVVDTDEDSGTSQSSMTVDPVITQGQLAIMAMYGQGGSGLSPMTLSGATENFERNSSELSISSGYLEDAGATVTWTPNTSDDLAMASATFRG